MTTPDTAPRPGPDSRPAALGVREIEMLERFAQILNAIQRPGASVHTTDSRFDRLQMWFIGVCAVGILGLLSWSINALVEQGLVQRETVIQMQALDRRVSRLEDAK
jgi:hypothetical protein